VAVVLGKPGAHALGTHWDITSDTEELERLFRVGGAEAMVQLELDQGDVKVGLEGLCAASWQCKPFPADGAAQMVLASVLDQIFYAFLTERVVAFQKFRILELVEAQ
jgi:hypothetical protein